MVTVSDQRKDMEDVWEKWVKQLEEVVSPVDFLNDFVSSIEDRRYFDTKTQKWVRDSYVLNLIEGVIPYRRYRVNLLTDGRLDYLLRVEESPYNFWQGELDSGKARRKANDIVDYIEDSICKEPWQTQSNGSVGRILKSKVGKNEVRNYIGVYGTHEEILTMLSTFPQDMKVIWKRADGDDVGTSIKNILQRPESILSDYGPPDDLDMYITDVVDDEIYLSDSSRIKRPGRK